MAGKANGKKLEAEFANPDPKVNSVRYFELDHEGPPVLRTVYISKDALTTIGNPKKLKVTIEAL